MKFSDFLSRFEKSRKTGKGYSVRCPAHEDRQASLSISEGNDGAILLKCFAGCKADEIVARMGLAMKDLFPEKNGNGRYYPPARREPEPRVASNKPVAPEAPEAKAEIDTIYSYRDALGVERYQAIRLRPKSFRQRHQVNGAWVWNMDAVERVLYNLPRVLTSQQVWIVEGEKDADNLGELGYVATCNVGGAGKWLDGYTESLAGKDVIICGDNDKPGQEHVSKVFESITGHVRSVRIIKVPLPHKDVSDLIEAMNDDEACRRFLEDLIASSVPFVDGIRLPLYSMAEIEPAYARQATESTQVCLRLNTWLPNISRYTRPLIPGEMMLLIGDTGTGKTALLVNAWRNCRNLRTIFFQMELPAEAMFERFVSTVQEMTGREVEKEYRENRPLGAAAMALEYPNLLICPESGLTIERLEQIIVKSELKFGAKPELILLDYAQLSNGEGRSRYERMSNFAEGLKILAKRTRTILVVASQVARPQGEDAEIGLHSAKDSGSLENSCGIAIGAWRDEKDPTLLHLKVLKATKGGSGTCEQCNFDGAKMIITGRARSVVSDEDMPDIPQPRNQHSNE